MAKLDEVAFNVLIADGLDVPTAYTGSIDDVQQPATRSNRRYFDFGLIAGLVVCILWLLW